MSRKQGLFVPTFHNSNVICQHKTASCIYMPTGCCFIISFYWQFVPLRHVTYSYKGHAFLFFHARVHGASQSLTDHLRVGTRTSRVLPTCQCVYAHPYGAQDYLFPQHTLYYFLHPEFGIHPLHEEVYSLYPHKDGILRVFRVYKYSFYSHLYFNIHRVLPTNHE